MCTQTLSALADGDGSATPENQLTDSGAEPSRSTAVNSIATVGKRVPMANGGHKHTRWVSYYLFHSVVVTVAR